MALSWQGILEHIKSGNYSEFDQVYYLLSENVIEKPNDPAILIHGIIYHAQDKYNAFLSWLDCNEECAYLAEWFRAPLPAR